MVNQILLHISNTPLELVEYCQKKGIAVEAYSPIAHGEILHPPEIASMAEKYGVSVPQLCIRYTLQLGAISLPKTGNPEHMKTNADVDFEISAEDMEVLHSGLAPDRESHNSSYLPDRHSFFPPPGKQTKLIIQRVKILIFFITFTDNANFMLIKELRELIWHRHHPPLHHL